MLLPGLWAALAAGASDGVEAGKSPAPSQPLARATAAITIAKRVSRFATGMFPALARKPKQTKQTKQGKP